MAAAGVLAFGTLGALAWTSLGGALAQLRAVDVLVRVAPSIAASEREPPPADTVENVEPPTDASPAAAATPAAAERDEHILHALVTDTEFMRAADELLREPDAQVQQEARQLLRELGAPAP